MRADHAPRAQGAAAVLQHLRRRLAERRRPRRWSPTSPRATGLLDAYNFGTLHVTAVAVNLKLRRDLRQAYLLAASAPTPRVAAAATSRSAILAQRVRGARFTKTIKVHVPRDLSKGTHILTLTGTPGRRGRRPGRRPGPQLDVHDQLGRRRRSSDDEPGPARRSTSWRRPSRPSPARTA